MRLRRTLSTLAALSLSWTSGCSKTPDAAPVANGNDAVAGTDAPATVAPNAAAAAARQKAPMLSVPEDVAAAPSDAQRTASGLASRVLKPGTGARHPTADDQVEVHYSGWTTDGKLFDSSVQRGLPARFPLGRVIKGWTEGVQLMVVGEKRRFWIPAELAYGNQPPPGAPAGTLVFDVELLQVAEGPKPIAAPSDVAAAPKSARRTHSHLAYKVLKKGHGKRHPRPTDQVEVHYSGWTTDGKMFDSSVQRGQPAVFPLNGVIPGWTEGLQLMTEGEKTRFWIPSALAYDNQPGRPAGTLVFDVELIAIR